MQDIDYSRQNNWLLYSFSCMHSEDSFIPDNRLVSSCWREIRCLTAPFSLWAPVDAGHFLCLGPDLKEHIAERLWPGLRFRGLWLKCLARGPKAWAARLSSGLALQLWLASHPPACWGIDQACAKYGLCQTS